MEEIQKTSPAWESKLDLVRNTCAPTATPAEFELFCYQAKRLGLDPLNRQIFAVKRWDSQSQMERLSLQVGIDGYRAIAARTGEYAGNDDYRFNDNKTEYRLIADNEKLITATATIYRLVGGQRVAFSATARFDEYVSKKKDGTHVAMWAKMPYLMIGKCAEALAFRKAFPAELSGIYTNEEMQQADDLPLPNNIEKKSAIHATNGAASKATQATETQAERAATPELKADLLNRYVVMLKTSFPQGNVKESDDFRNMKKALKAVFKIDDWSKIEKLSQKSLDSNFDNLAAIIKDMKEYAEVPE